MYGFVSLINYSIYDLSGSGLARETITAKIFRGDTYPFTG